MKSSGKKYKLKTKCAVKKRFRAIKAKSSPGACGFFVIGGQANKRHNMRKRSNRQIRDQRGTQLLRTMEARRMLKYMPYRVKFN